MFSIAMLCLSWMWSGDQDPHARLEALFQRDWALELQRDTGFASMMGHQSFDTVWDDISMAALQRDFEANAAILADLRDLDPASLSPQDRLNYELFAWKLSIRAEGFGHGWSLIPLTQRGGIQTASELAERLDFEDRADYERWLEKLTRFPTYMDQTIALMRAGIERKRLLPKIVMQRVVAQIDAQIVADPMDSPFFLPFKRMPETLDGREQLLTRAKAVILDQVIPAFAGFRKFYVETYLPACPEQVGICHLPGGKELYAHLAREHTTTELTPEQIHEIGLKEVARIHGEMEAIIAKVGHQGDFASFLHFLRTDPRFYYKTGAELMAAYEALAKRIDPTLVKLFRKMPRMPYGVAAIPDQIAPDTTTAYYQKPNPDGTKAGYYFVNLYKPETRPIYEMEALSLHESVPGHHFQIALTQELGELPNFRRYDNLTAFAEGWALYAESLGEELGFYQDPYSKFGQLTYEMWRAVRLVVDTGIHYYGWDRQKAIDFFMANAAKTENDIVNEIDRYIAWPGQALGYKIGELKIKELRQLAETKLGKSFDVRAFHDVVLGSGSLPLSILDRQVRAWIDAGGK